MNLPANTDLTPADALLAVLAGATGIAGSFAVAGYTRQFVVAPIDALVVQLTPGPIVAWMIENVGETGHLLHIALSVLLATGLLAGVALIGIAAARHWRRPLAGPAFAGGVAWGLAAGITREPVLALGAGVPVALFTAVATVRRPSVAAASAVATDAVETTDASDTSRRRVLTAGVAALAFGGVSTVVGRRMTESGVSNYGSTVGVDEAVTDRFDLANERALDLASDDVPGLVSPIENFYNVDIAEFDPEVPADDWSMTITGAVEADVSLSFDELTDQPVEHRFVSLRCVGEDLNGWKLDTAVWTGTPIAPLLADADPDGGCGCAMLRAEDDYYVQFPVDALEDALLVWGMNGQPLPKSHGHPVRVLVPGHWGETNVKWLDEIELLDEEADGYWEERGWHGTGPVNTVAKLWDDTLLDDGRIELAGHAYAGTRGVERVEVSTDGGETWTDAELSAPLPGDDVWRQWRHVFDPSGTHEVVVRATDGTGTLQPRDRSDSFPSGATGWVTESISADR